MNHPSENQQFCEQCSALLSENSNFCESCGAPVAKEKNDQHPSDIQEDQHEPPPIENSPPLESSPPPSSPPPSSPPIENSPPPITKPKKTSKKVKTGCFITSIILLIIIGCAAAWWIINDDKKPSRRRSRSKSNVESQAATNTESLDKKINNASTNKKEANNKPNITAKPSSKNKPRPNLVPYPHPLPAKSTPGPVTEKPLEYWVATQSWFKQLSASLPKGVTPSVTVSAGEKQGWKSVEIREIHSPESAFDPDVSPLIGIFHVSSNRKTVQWMNPLTGDWTSLSEFSKSRMTTPDDSAPALNTKLAANELAADIDNDGKLEIIRWEPYSSSGANKFYQLSVIDDNGKTIWKSVKTKSTDHVHAFFESDFGISLPQLLHDINGDGSAELLAPVPQSDVSATYFRVLSWNDGIFSKLPSRALMMATRNAKNLQWKEGDHSFGIWVSKFASVTAEGLVTASVTSLSEDGDYQSGTALLRFNSDGAAIEKWISPLQDPDAQADPNNEIETHKTPVTPTAKGMLDAQFSIDIEYSPSARKKLVSNKEKLSVSLIVDQYGAQYMEEEAIAVLDQKFAVGDKIQFNGIPLSNPSYQINPLKRYRLTVAIFSAREAFKNNIVEGYSKQGVTDWNATHLNGKTLHYVCKLMGEDFQPTQNNPSQTTTSQNNDDHLFTKTLNAYNADEMTNAEAFASFMTLAKRGQVDAMNAIGSLYISGSGVQKNTQQAMRWFNMAAEKGNHKAMFALGYMYDNGEGVPKNLSTARQWFLKSAKAGNKKAAHNMGYIYSNGEGVKQDKTKARSWYLRGAQLGNPKSMGNLGNSYCRGDGGKQNLTLAHQWLICGATRGNENAANSLGIIYSNGNGVQKDPILACRWWAVSVRGGYTEAETKIKAMAKKMKWKNFDWRTLSPPKEMIAAEKGELPPLPE